MYRMLLRSRRYAGRFFKRRSWDLYTPQKVPNPYGAGYIYTPQHKDLGPSGGRKGPKNVV